MVARIRTPTLAVVASSNATLQLATTEAPDIVAVNASVIGAAQLAAAEAPDIVAATVVTSADLQVAASEAPDVVAITLSTTAPAEPAPPPVTGGGGFVRGEPMRRDPLGTAWQRARWHLKGEDEETIAAIHRVLRMAMDGSAPYPESPTNLAAKALLAELSTPTNFNHAREQTLARALVKAYQFEKADNDAVEALLKLLNKQRMRPRGNLQ